MFYRIGKIIIKMINYIIYLYDSVQDDKDKSVIIILRIFMIYNYYYTEK